MLLVLREMLRLVSFAYLFHIYVRHADNLESGRMCRMFTPQIPRVTCNYIKLVYMGLMW